MCGIAGSISWIEGRLGATDLFDIEELRYRGPDAIQTVRSADLLRTSRHFEWKLAHARLSIVDLDDSANQPMCSEDGRHWIVFNGEIYNHRELRTELETIGRHFRTDHSDTEVLLQACIEWGPSCLDRLNGMFAFVFLDDRTGRLFGARDRMGIKPFYYREENGVLTFASEPKAIRGERRIARDQLLNYFNFLQVPGSETFFHGIKKLPAAHYFELTGGVGLEPVRYWHPLAQGNGARFPRGTKIRFELLEDSVRAQMEADVAVGTYLSGGLDSSLLTALASRTKQVNTFSIGFEEGIPGYASELPYARLVGKHLNTRYHEVTISPSDYLAAQQRVFRILDEPIANEACGPLLLLSEKARAEGVIVCLSGEGSDELFIGYRHWHDALRVDRVLRNLPKALLKAYIGSGAPGLSNRKPDWVSWIARASRGEYILWGGNDAMSTMNSASVFDPGFLAGSVRPYDAVERSNDGSLRSGADFLQQLSVFDLSFRLPENLLARVDRMSMSASIEARVPYLDHRLVEYAMRIPVDDLVSRNGEKLALKRYASSLLPDAIIQRPKVGFTIPLHEVLNTREALNHRDLILSMDDELRIYAQPFREKLTKGEVTGMALWPHFALASWWSIHCS